MATPSDYYPQNSQTPENSLQRYLVDHKESLVSLFLSQGWVEILQLLSLLAQAPQQKLMSLQVLSLEQNLVAKGELSGYNQLAAIPKELERLKKEMEATAEMERALQEEQKQRKPLTFKEGVIK